MIFPIRRALPVVATPLPAATASPTTQAQPTSTLVLDTAARAEVLNVVLERVRRDYVFLYTVPRVEAALADLEYAKVLEPRPPRPPSPGY